MIPWIPTHYFVLNHFAFYFFGSGYAALGIFRQFVHPLTL